jgi:hypothetical protein
MISPAFRTLLAKTGDAIDTAWPPNLRELRAARAAPDAKAVRFAMSTAAAAGIAGLQVLSSPALDAVCLPIASSPPTILIGDGLWGDERIGSFLVVRALKLVRNRASALARVPSAELSMLIAAWLKCLSPSWQPKWLPRATLDAESSRVRTALPRSLDPDLGMLALEVASSMDAQPLPLGRAALQWADRVALLALGDPNGALDAIAASSGDASGDRTNWISRSEEARALVTFGVSDGFAEARSRLRLDR